jgi:hypothetical protein
MDLSFKLLSAPFSESLVFDAFADTLFTLPYLERISVRGLPRL